jgi:hypothetical protein
MFVHVCIYGITCCCCCSRRMHGEPCLPAWVSGSRHHSSFRQNIISPQLMSEFVSRWLEFRGAKKFNSLSHANAFCCRRCLNHVFLAVIIHNWAAQRRRFSSWSAGLMHDALWQQRLLYLFTSHDSVKHPGSRQ